MPPGGLHSANGGKFTLGGFAATVGYPGIKLPEGGSLFNPNGSSTDACGALITFDAAVAKTGGPFVPWLVSTLGPEDPGVSALNPAGPWEETLRLPTTDV